MSIVIANVLTAKYSPFVLFDGHIIIPVGSVFVGVTFLLRDVVQIKHGKRKAYTMIFTALFMSAAISAMMGDTASVAFASGLSFLLSESIDTEIFSRVRRNVRLRMLASGVIGGGVDSAVFVTVGLGPFGSGALTWDQVPYAIIGQAAIKAAVQIAVIGVIESSRRGTNESICN